jgi:hypothetical protein
MQFSLRTANNSLSSMPVEYRARESAGAPFHPAALYLSGGKKLQFVTSSWKGETEKHVKAQIFATRTC